QRPDGVTAEQAAALAAGTGEPSRTFRSPVVWPLKEILKAPTIWLMAVASIAHGQAIFMVTSHGVLHLTDLGFGKMQAAGVLSFIIFGAGAARFPVGWLGDRIEPRWLISVCITGMALCFLGIWKAPSIRFLMFVGPLFGFCYGGVIVLNPAIVGNYFGAEVFPAVNGFLAPLLTVFGAIVPVAAGMVAESTGSYDLAFKIIGVMLVCAIVCALLLAPPEPRWLTGAPAKHGD
ncbi:nitrate/nitrite transporter, partial [Thermodesulfobacteriota bacterium]